MVSRESHYYQSVKGIRYNYVPVYRSYLLKPCNLDKGVESL